MAHDPDYFPSSLAPSCIDFTNDQPSPGQPPSHGQPPSPARILSEGFYSIQWSINDEDRIGTRDFEITSDPTDDYTQIMNAFPLEELDGQTSEENHQPSRMIYPSAIYPRRKMTVTAPKFAGRQLSRGHCSDRISRGHCSDRIENPRSPADVCGVPYSNRYRNSEASSSSGYITELASVVIESRSSSGKQDAPPLTVSGCQSPLSNMSDSTSSLCSPILSLPQKSIDPACPSLRKSTCKSVPLEILGCHPNKVGGPPALVASELYNGVPFSDGESIRRQLNELTTRDDTTDDFDPQDTLNWLEICLNYSDSNPVLENPAVISGMDDLAWDPKGLRVTGCSRSWAKVETRESARIGPKPEQPMKVARMVEISINNEITTEWDTLINRILRESEEERESMRIELENEKETLRRQTDEQTAKIHRDLNRLESELNRVELEKAELGSNYSLDCRRMKAETERLERCLKDITASYNRLETSYCDKETRHKQDLFRMQSCLESKNNELRNLVQQTQSQDKSGEVATLEAELETLRAAIASQNLSLANLTSQNHQLTTLNTELQTQAISKEQKKALEFEEAKENFETIKKNCSNLAESLQKTMRLYETLKKRNVPLEEHEELKAQYSENLKKLRAELSDVLDQLETAKEQVVSSDRQAESLLIDLEDARKMMKEVEEKAQSAVRDATRRTQDAESAMKVKNQMMEEQANYMNKMREKITRLETDIQQRGPSNSELKTENENLKKEVQEKISCLDLVVGEIDSLRLAREAERRKETEERRREIEERKRGADRLRSEVEVLRAEVQNSREICRREAEEKSKLLGKESGIFHLEKLAEKSEWEKLLGEKSKVIGNLNKQLLSFKKGASERLQEFAMELVNE